MRLRLLGLGMLLTLTLSACTQATPDGDGDKGGPQTFTIKVDAKSEKFDLATTAFFPKELSARPGDTVRFEVVFTGEPHTVTFGTNVDAAVAAIEKLTPEQRQQGAAAGLPELGQDVLPDIFPPDPTKPANQSAGQPCFLDTGNPPGADACAKTPQPDFNGTQSFYNLGYFAEDDEQSVKLADALAPGTYSFMCLVHRDGMIGTLEVAAPGAEVPSPADIDAAAAKQLTDLETALQGAVDQLGTATSDKALAGNASPEIRDAFVVQFGPEEASISVGGTVTFLVFGPHTISLNAPEDAALALIRSADGVVSINGRAAGPTNAPPPPPPSFVPGAQPTTTNATWNGEGFFNTGFLLSFPPALATYSVKITKAGTYDLQCLIHPDMKGKIKVG